MSERSFEKTNEINVSEREGGLNSIRELRDGVAGPVAESEEGLAARRPLLIQEESISDVGRWIRGCSGLACAAVTGGEEESCDNISGFWVLESHSHFQLQDRF